MKYQNKQNGKVTKSVELDEKSKCYDIIFEDGSSTRVSGSTFKRWYKALKEDNVVEETEPETVEEELSGDGTPLAEVGKEIVEQAKQKVKQVKKKKKREKDAGVDIEEQRSSIEGVCTELGCTTKVHDSQNRKLLIIKDGKTLCRVYMANSKCSICVAVKSLPDDVTPDRVRNCPLGAVINTTYEEVCNKLKSLVPNIKVVEKTKKSKKEEN